MSRFSQKGSDGTGRDTSCRLLAIYGKIYMHCQSEIRTYYRNLNRKEKNKEGWDNFAFVRLVVDVCTCFVVLSSIDAIINFLTWLAFLWDADSSRAPGLTSGLQGSVNVHRGALLLVPQWQCISSFVFYFMFDMYDWSFFFKLLLNKN